MVFIITECMYDNPLFSEMVLSGANLEVLALKEGYDKGLKDLEDKDEVIPYDEYRKMNPYDDSPDLYFGFRPQREEGISH